jgi:hypothetical protein
VVLLFSTLTMKVLEPLSGMKANSCWGLPESVGWNREATWPWVAGKDEPEEAG